MSERRLAKLIIDAMPTALHREILWAATAHEIDAERRVLARKIEQAARTQAAASASADCPEPQHHSVADFQRLRDDPTLWRVERGGDHIWFNSDERRRFRSWRGFEQWLEGALKTDVHEDFQVDWVPGYAEERRWAQISSLITQVSAQVRFEVTAELLDTVFATGGGTRVSWRDATVAEHEERIGMLTKMAA